MKLSILLKILCVFFWLISKPVLATIDVYEFDNVAQEAQYRGLIDEFRCPKCQNQNLAGSDAPIAQDLKQKTYEMVKEGRTDGEIRQYMIERYGDFISYKPPIRPSTWILWFFPPILLLIGLLGWWVRHRHQKLRQTAKHQRHEILPLSATEQQKLDSLLQLSVSEEIHVSTKMADQSAKKDH